MNVKTLTPLPSEDSAEKSEDILRADARSCLPSAMEQKAVVQEIKIVSIYTLADPRTPMDIRYVGKTESRLAERLAQHIRTSHEKKKAYRQKWLYSLLKAGVTPIISLLEVVAVDVWQRKEKEWIAKFRALGARLTNTSTGGDGMDSAEWKAIWSSPELRQRQSDMMRERRQRPDMKEKMAAAMKARWNNPEAHERHSELMREVASREGVRQKRTEDTRASWKNKDIRQKRMLGLAKCSFTEEGAASHAAAQVRRWLQPNARKNASIKAKTRWNDPIKREQIRAAMRASRKSPEAKAVASEAIRKGWITRRTNQLKSCA